MTMQVSYHPWLFDFAEFAQMVATHRQASGLTQVELGDMIGVSGSYIGYVERNIFDEITLRIDHAVQICNLFEVDVRDYFIVE